jgi:hypothetical protein
MASQAPKLTLLKSHLTHRDEGDGDARFGTCTRERTGSVLHESGLGRDQAIGRRSSKPGPISLSGFTRLHHILLPQRQTENSESEA